MVSLMWVVDLTASAADGMISTSMILLATHGHPWPLCRWGLSGFRFHLLLTIWVMLRRGRLVRLNQLIYGNTIPLRMHGWQRQPLPEQPARPGMGFPWTTTMDM